MPDYLGPTQTRVLDPNDRSFESVVAQKKKPPLSCEWNLMEDLQLNREQEILKSVIPSGWTTIGDIKENINESECYAGDVLTSPSLPANSFKLIALDKGQTTRKNSAYVNGWKILVQGTNLMVDDNLIILPPPPTNNYRIDFVYLEVWKKLITPTDVIYKYGNKGYGGTNFQNDLIDPYKGIETSLRVQLQYQIRIATDVDIDDFPEGFDPNNVFAQGAMDTPLTNFNFTQFFPVFGDIGLWRAGFGGIPPTPGQPSDSQVLLGTVDGYTYALPMFAVFRRSTDAYNYNTSSSSSGKSLADYLNGVASDRPDNKYNDWITADDIVDLRHLVSLSGVNYKELCEKAFKKLIAGNLRTKLDKTNLGGINYGTRLLKADSISPVDEAGTERIGVGNIYQRNFSNAQIDQPRTLLLLTGPYTGANIVGIAGDLPPNSNALSVQNIFSHANPPIDMTNVSLTSNVLSFTVPSGSVNSVIADLTLRFDSGSNGLANMPDTILEAQEKVAKASIPIDSEITIRGANPVAIRSDSTRYNTVGDHGASFVEPYDFGIQVVWHTQGNGTQFISSIPRTYQGYNILGIMNIKFEDSSGNMQDETVISVTRNLSNYTVQMGHATPSNRDIQFTLYAGTKFFSANNQGRAITDTFEMVELTADQTGDGVSTAPFHFDSTSKAILAIASYSNGTSFGYADGSQVNLAPIGIDNPNKFLPVDGAHCKFVYDATFANPPSAGSTVTIPFMVNSAIEPTETYSFFYMTKPYEGQLDSTISGKIETVGPAITTTAGSGTITDYTYSQGLIFQILTDGTKVTGVLGTTQWLSNVRVGYIFTVDSTKEYIIDSIATDNILYLVEKYDGSVSSPSPYIIKAKNQPYFTHPNIIDQLPALHSSSDSSAKSDEISFVYSDQFPVLENSIVSRTQDIVDAKLTDMTIGVNSADRGRSTIDLNGNLGLGNLGLSLDKLDTTSSYKKSYQSYILNKVEDSTQGRLYLLVAGTETDNSSSKNYFNEKSNNDVVDIFEIPGRPIK